MTDKPVRAQSGIYERILTRLNDYYLNVPYEEVFVHCDRQDYIAGEDIWFNVFIIDRGTGKPSVKSRIAYFELLNPDNFPVIQKRIIISNGHGPGNVLLPDSLSSGMHTVRVYTNWMKNFMPADCFMKTINIFNTFRDNGFKRKIVYEKNTGKSLNIEFFPEGGTLLYGVSSRVAVKVYDRYQRGLQFKGIVRNTRADSVAGFKTDEFGTASFEFTPEDGERYYVSASDINTYLPEPAANGYSIQVNNSLNDSVLVVVNASGRNQTEADNPLLLIINTNSAADYYKYLSLSGKHIRIAIPRADLSNGINRITLFGNDGIPVCERLILTKNNTLSGSILSGNDYFRRREKVTMDLDLVKAGIKSATGTRLSVSVASQSADYYSQEIDDYLVFGTEYGILPWDGTERSISDVSNNTIDNFLITAESGWVSWEKILSGKVTPFEYLPEKEGHLLSGWMKQRDAQVNDTAELVYLSVPGKTATFQYARTTGTGHFVFLLPPDYSAKNLHIQPANPERGFTIQIESSYSWKFPESVSYVDSASKEFPRKVSNLSAGYQIGRIYGTLYKKDNSAIEDLTPGLIRFYGRPEVELRMADYISLPVVQEIFFELLPGVKLRSKRSGYEIQIFNPTDNVIYEEPPLVMIDGVVIKDLELLANLDPENIERIDATRIPYLTGDIIHFGIVNVITKTGNLKNITLPDYVARLAYRVGDPISEFYAPDYSDPVSRQSRKPDFRNTLFWDPSLKPGNDGRIRIEFWTSDIVADYTVNIQGISGDGDLISVQKVIHVEK